MKTNRSIFSLFLLALLVSGVFVSGCSSPQSAAESASAKDDKKDPAKNHDPATVLGDKNDK